MKRPRYVMYDFDDHDKPELERWLVLEHRLCEVEEALRQVHRNLGKSRKSRRNVSDSGISTRSNYCFAAVTYMRCFSAGRHRHLSIDSIPGLTAKNAETHSHVRELRNKFFAHAVADQEGEDVYLHSPSVGEPINGFGVMSIVMLCDSKQGVRSFINLVSRVRKHVLAQSELVGDKIASRFFGPGASWQKLSKK